MELCPSSCESGSLTCNYTNCECPPGWGKFGDFSVEDTQPCEFNLVALTVLWSLQTVMWMAFMLGSIWALVLITCQARSLRRRFRGERAMLSLKSCTGVCFTAVGVLKAADPGRNVIGLDPTTTWLFCIGATSFWVDMLLFFIVQTSTHLISLAVARSKNLAFMYQRVYPFLILVACVGTFSPLGVLYGNPQDHFMFGQLHYIVLGIILFMLIFVFVVAMEMVLVEIRFAMITHNSHGQGGPGGQGGQNNSTGATGTTGTTPTGSGTAPPSSDDSSFDSAKKVIVVADQVAADPNRPGSTTSRDPRRDLVKTKLTQIETQVVAFRRDGMFHLFSGPISIAIGISPLLLRNSSYYLPVIWTLAGLTAVNYTAFSLRAIRAATGGGNNPVNKQQQALSSDSLIDNNASAEESSDRFPMQGLGIMAKKNKRKPKWNAKMSRITEISENGTRVVSIERVGEYS